MFQIIVLENGKVVEQGPHDFLLSQGGRYAELWSQQNNSDAIDAAPVNLEVWLMIYVLPFCKGNISIIELEKVPLICAVIGVGFYVRGEQKVTVLGIKSPLQREQRGAKFSWGI
jgi:hypothetical protein